MYDKSRITVNDRAKDVPETRDFLSNTNTSELKLAIGDHKIIIIDEAKILNLKSFDSIINTPNNY